MKKTREYLRYINSAAWKHRADMLKRFRGLVCESCQKTFCTPSGLDVHHLTYERLGQERDGDLVVLCRPCHVIADEQRQASVREHHYTARVWGWAEAKYGEDWEYVRDWEDVEAEFSEWLDQQEEA